MPQREGCKVGIYRSKLEQSWAMFFVGYGIPFIHEPRYYGNWLPDFELPDCRAIIEVKPTLEIAKKEVPRYYEGMRVAFHERRDIVLLISRPTKEDISIGGFADSTYGDEKSEEDYFKQFWDCHRARMVQCRECGAYCFVGSPVLCRKCGNQRGIFWLLGGLYGYD